MDVSCLPVQVLEFKPVAMDLSPSDDYMLSLKQEMRGAMRRLPCYLTPNAAKSGEEASQPTSSQHLMQSHSELNTHHCKRILPYKNCNFVLM